MVAKMKTFINFIKDFFLKKYKVLYDKLKYTTIQIQSKESAVYGKMKKTSSKKKSGNGLTAKQKTLPSALQKKIMKSKKKKK